MINIYLSYPRPDYRRLSIAHILAHQLSARGVNILNKDEFFAGSDLQTSMFSAIKKADVLVAILDSPKTSANVMLETGYAIGAGKQVILLYDNPAEIPFDLSSMPVLAIDQLCPRSLMDIIQKIEQLGRQYPSEHKAFRSNREHLAQSVQDSDFLEQMSPLDFETLIGNYFIEIGIAAEIYRYKDKSGVDIVLRFGDMATAVFAKKFTSQGRLGIGDVQRFVSTCIADGMKTGLMVTNTEFTTSAKEFALASPVRLVLLTLKQLLNESKESLKIHFTQASRPTTPEQ